MKRFDYELLKQDVQGSQISTNAQMLMIYWEKDYNNNHKQEQLLEASGTQGTEILANTFVFQK